MMVTKPDSFGSEAVWYLDKTNKYVMTGQIMKKKKKQKQF